MSGRPSIRRWEGGLLLFILILAIGLRIYRLQGVPPGLTHDEASNAHDAVQVLQGVWPVYFTGAYGHEPLYAYTVAPFMALFGETEIALRVTTVAWGLALIVLTYGYARRLFGPLPALGAAGWLAVSFWGVMISRVGLRAVTLATTFTASVLSFWLGLRTCTRDEGTAIRDPALPLRPWIAWGVGGLFLGASLYTYMASRMMPAIYVVFLVYLCLLAWLGRAGECHAAGWQGIVIVLVIAGITVAPLAHFLVTHPEAEQRIDQLSAPLREAVRGDFRPLGHNVSQGLLALVHTGDTTWRYGIPGRPLVDLGSRLFLLIGVAYSLWQWRDRRHAFLLLWLIVGLASALAVGSEGVTLRAIGVLPAIAVLIGLGLSHGIRGVMHLARAQIELEGRSLGLVSVALFIAGIGLHTGHDYFLCWGEHREVRVTYYHALVEQARYLDAQADTGAVVLSTQYPGQFHDPYTMAIVLRREDLDLRWFHGESAFILPNADNTRVIIPTLVSIDETLRPDFLAGVLRENARLVHRELLGPYDFVSSFEVYRVDVGDAVATLLSEMGNGDVYWSPVDRFPDEDPQAAYKPLALPVTLGNAVELVGYEVSASTVSRDEKLDVVTLWRVIGPMGGEAIQFTHLLDQGGEVVSQVDRLDVPSWQWKAGDLLVQRHRLEVNGDAEPGLHHLQVGLYTQDDMIRLPVIVDGVVKDDRVLLPPVQIGGP